MPTKLHLQRYAKLIQYAKNHCFASYTEKHHILPVSMGGSDSPDNLVILSARLHFIAHWLLWKAYKNSEMTAAFFMMCNTKSPGQQRYQKISSKVYAALKEDFSLNHHMKRPEIAAKISGDNSPSKSAISIAKRSGTNHFSAKADYKCKTAGDNHHMKRPEIVSNISGENHYTKQDGWVSKLTGDNNPSRRPERRAAMAGDNNPARRPEVREKMSVNGSMHRPDVVAKISGENHYSNATGYVNPRKGKPDTKIICPHCGKEGGQSNIKRWHFDNCKFRLTG